MAKLHPVEVKQTPELLQSRESEILKILELGEKKSQNIFQLTKHYR